MSKLKVGIIGSTGYVGVELIRILLNHDGVELVGLSSTSFEGKGIEEVYGNLYSICSLKCESTEKVVEKSDFLFLALPHGLSEEIASKALSAGKKVVDLGADFRLASEEAYEKWYGKPFAVKELHGEAVYGLPEFNREKIKEARLIANPGCYPTSISLPLMPLLKKSLVSKKGIVADSKSGVTGAGRGLSLTTHFPECNENFAAYKIGSHRHIPEIEQNLSTAAGEDVSVTFTPHLLPINRGILSTIYCDAVDGVTTKDIHEELCSYYANEPFVKVLPLGEAVALKNVKFSNLCHISVHSDERTKKVIICSTIDNMVKGAAGQAVQNLNIMMGFDEQKGLKLLAPAF